jgi:hypothetical protein
MIVRDGSLLDDEGLALLAECAVQHDAQIFVERVGKGAECSFVIEDGAVEAEACDHGKREDEECPACDHDRLSDGETDGARL